MTHFDLQKPSARLMNFNKAHSIVWKTIQPTALGLMISRETMEERDRQTEKYRKRKILWHER